MENEDKILEEWCKESSLNYKLALSLKNLMLPLLESAHKNLGYLFDRIYLEQRHGMELRLENSARLLTILKKIDRKLFSPEEVKVLSIHLEFMPLVEGFYSTQINFLIALLIANGYEFKPFRKGRAVFTIPEIEKVDLSKRLEFLKKQGFPQVVINEHMFRALRNSTAHMFYQVQPDLSVKTGICDLTHDDYLTLYDYLREVSFCLFNVQRLFYKKLYENLTPDEIKIIENSKLKNIVCSNCGYTNIAVESPSALGFEPTICTKCLKELKPNPK